ncbi:MULTISPECIES: UDP-glucuronic acid decarboxylase family protein [unclassified Streptomyces]|uniref:UDP-glucuronic acid decarboxylase family protein n=1 Tax=unclassified Streptomyces TaxID=2593676 RepID=UPI002258C1DB|nr:MULTISPECIES: UDP-glucuronic acid decarboxylase family protein [unclassified Streptomyces]MCX5328555.1 SDR family oxidoreductase [Streptomyces sp. NBC_00140]MCX5357962.1 SDR family oxidoreductase [Streptomyces sp. NBC_00124]
MRVVISGGSGFLGSHLCEALLGRGDRVCCLDDFSSGRAVNVGHLMREPGFECVPCDVTERTRVTGDVDAVVHLASAASPFDYSRRPLQTLAAGSRGTENLLRLALRHQARFVLASTSEVYGDPEVHPQDEDYWGHVNPIGPRSVYGEAKRFAEALAMASRRSEGADTGIVRIFNTYGPRMRPHDGRVVSTFIRQALDGQALTIFGDGSQTRSFCYVDDLIRGLLAMVDTDVAGPFNLGNPSEWTMRELASLVLLITGSDGGLRFLPLPVDDPVRRRPVITRAREGLGWHPMVPLEAGLRRTVAWSAAHSDTSVGPQGPAPAGGSS